MTLTPYEEINYLEDWTFIGGSSWQLNFTTFEEDGVTPLDMTGGSAGYTLVPLGDSLNVVVDKTGVFTDITNGLWYVLIETADTEDLSGVFTAQPELTDFGGDVFLPGQGRVTVLPRNMV